MDYLQVVLIALVGLLAHGKDAAAVQVRAPFGDSELEAVSEGSQEDRQEVFRRDDRRIDPLLERRIERAQAVSLRVARDVDHIRAPGRAGKDEEGGRGTKKERRHERSVNGEGASSRYNG